MPFQGKKHGKVPSQHNFLHTDAPLHTTGALFFLTILRTCPLNIQIYTSARAWLSNLRPSIFSVCAWTVVQMCELTSVFLSSLNSKLNYYAPWHLDEEMTGIIIIITTINSIITITLMTFIIPIILFCCTKGWWDRGWLPMMQSTCCWLILLLNITFLMNYLLVDSRWEDWCMLYAVCVVICMFN